jgi:hypothetical protein
MTFRERASIDLLRISKPLILDPGNFKASAQFLVNYLGLRYLMREQSYFDVFLHILSGFYPERYKDKHLKKIFRHIC